MIRSERPKYDHEYYINGEGCFTMDVQNPVNGQYLCLDATRAYREYGPAGRLINHARVPNLKPVQCIVDGVLRVGFIALVDIPEGSECLFNYGVRYNSLPWEKNNRVS